MSDLEYSQREGPDPPRAGVRPPYRPPIGMPEAGESRAPGLLVSIALHALVIFLLTSPVLFVKLLDATIPPGAGGPGPAGGGGGGMLGTGARALQERLQFLHIVAPAPQVPIAPPVVVPPPLPVPPPEEEPEAVQQAEPVPPAAAMSGSDGGSGADGSTGSGPGTGGGIGSGTGTGTGSGTGSGTGGGDAEIYPPTLTQLALLPLPVPKKVRPYTMVASFDVDERGNSRLIGFNPSKDGGYNRRIMDMLREIRFRPAVRKDGTPVRDTAVVTAIAP